jgi:hypothetical protein
MNSSSPTNVRFGSSSSSASAIRCFPVRAIGLGAPRPPTSFGAMNTAASSISPESNNSPSSDEPPQHGRFTQSSLIDRRGSGEQLVERDAERIDVGAGIDIELVERRLLRRHILRSADDRPETGVQRLLGQRPTGRLGHAEVDDFRNGMIVVQGDQHAGRLDIAMNDPLLMSFSPVLPPSETKPRDSNA